jgi:dihydrolipoamide dehydrogenase
MSETLDVIIIGAGSAGLAALREVRKRTQSFVIINDGLWGTICARVGCMPSKALIEAANAFYHRNTFTEFGIRGADLLSPDIPAVLRRIRRLRDDFVASTVRTTEDLGERAISGRAHLLGPDRLEVNGQILCARNIIIATGSSPIVPKPWNTLGKPIFTTDTLFEQENLPARMAVLGMGPIGVSLQPFHINTLIHHRYPQAFYKEERCHHQKHDEFISKHGKPAECLKRHIAGNMI